MIILFWLRIGCEEILVADGIEGIMKQTIEYEYDKYHVINEREFSEYKGKYRIIQYDTGFYGLQKSEDGTWVTVLVSPLKDKIQKWDDDIEFGIYTGRMAVMDIFNSIQEADKSFNGGYWELRLYLSEFGEENFTEIITRGDGETLLGQVKDLFELEEKQRLHYIENYPKVQILIYSCIILVLLLIIIIISVYGGLV